MAIGEPDLSHCGYCDAEGSTSASYYLVANRLKPSDYQDLIDRGWRRSGRNTLYLPENLATCCPQYSIRLPVLDFKPTKSTNKKWKKFCATTNIPADRDIAWDLIESSSVLHLSSEFSIILRQAPVFSQEIYELFLKYQENIHKDPRSRWPPAAYTRFLVNSPFIEEPNPVSGYKCFYNSHYWCYGTKHLEFYFQGKCIGVSVVDILPKSISSVYFFYDTAYKYLSLGTISALIEISLTRFLSKLDHALQYYYMGYYIESCPKMNYKGSYFPSYLLDRKSTQWLILDKSLRDALKRCKKFLADFSSSNVILEPNVLNNIVLSGFSGSTTGTRIQDLPVGCINDNFRKILTQLIKLIGHDLVSKFEINV